MLSLFGDKREKSFTWGMKGDEQRHIKDTINNKINTYINKVNNNKVFLFVEM